jgi:hypothetical protein
MSRNGSGVYSLPAGNPVVTNTTISSTWANNTLTDLATAMTGSVAADGQTPITGNLQMGSNRITGLADGIASTDAATVNQITGFITTGTAILKGNGTGGIGNAVAGIDYCAATTGSTVLKGSSGSTAVATAGTDYTAPTAVTNFSKQQYFGNATLTDASTISWNAESAQVATFTFVSSNRTMGAPTNLVDGAYYGLAIIQNAGSNTLTWNSVFKWASGTAPTLSTGAGAKDYFVFRSDGTNMYEQGRSLGVS